MLEGEWILGGRFYKLDFRHIDFEADIFMKMFKNSDLEV